MPRPLSFFMLKMYYPSVEVERSEEMSRFETMVREVLEENMDLAATAPQGKARVFADPEDGAKPLFIIDNGVIYRPQDWHALPSKPRGR